MTVGIEPPFWTEPEDEPVTEDDGSRTAHWGHCEDDDCGTAMIVYALPDRGSDLPDQEDWEEPFTSCPVCGAQIMWGGSDPAHHLIRNY